MPNLPLLSGPQDPSQLEAQINAVIQEINAGISGLFSAQTGAIGNGADTTDDILHSIIIPANFFTAPGQSMRFTASGTTGGNTNNKQIKFKSGSTTLLTSGTVTTNAGSWYMEGILTFTGTNANTFGSSGIAGATAFANNTSPNLTTTAAITISVTGASGTTGAANDVICNQLIAEIIK